jgi:hypothetical protein
MELFSQLVAASLIVLAGPAVIVLVFAQDAGRLPQAKVRGWQ